MAEPTLGEILAEAMAGELSPVERVVADTIADIWRGWEADAERIASQAMVAAGNALAAALAPLLHSTADEVFDALGHLPDAMLRHLASPQGWSVLACHAAAALGADAPDYAPTVH